MSTPDTPPDPDAPEAADAGADERAMPDPAPEPAPAEGDGADQREGLSGAQRGVFLVLIGVAIMFASLVLGVLALEHRERGSVLPSERTCQKVAIHEGHPVSRAECAAILQRLQERIDRAHERPGLRSEHRREHRRGDGAPPQTRGEDDAPRAEGRHQPDRPAERTTPGGRYGMDPAPASAGPAAR